MSILKKIRDRERKLPAAENRVSENEDRPTPSEFLRSTPQPGEIRLPPSRRCLAPDCPGPAAIWVSIYDRDEPDPTFRCWGCDPPPSASMVDRRWLLVIENGTGADPSSDRWAWEPLERFDPRNDGHDQPNPKTLAGSGNVGGRGAGDAWHNCEPATITAADGSRITIFEPVGWNDLLRLTVRHGADEAWRMLQERTELKLPAA